MVEILVINYMSTTLRVIKNTSYLYIKMALTIFISLYTTRIILEVLGTSDFGIYNIIGGAIVLLGFLNSTMANATQRFMSYAEGKRDLLNKKKVFNVSLALHIAVAIATVVLLSFAALFFFNGVLNIPPSRIFAAKVIYFSMLVSTAFTILNVPYDAVMNAHENMLYYSLIGVLDSVLRLIVALFCIYTSHDKLIIYGILIASIPFITLSITKVYCHKKYEECVISIYKYWDLSMAKQITSFFSWNFLTAISSIASFYGMGIVLNHFFGTLLNAAQGIANQINGQMSNLSLNLMKAVNPIIVKRAGSNDIGAMNRATLLSGKFSTLLIVLFAIPFILEINYILQLWLVNVPQWTPLFCSMQLIVTIICQMASSSSTAIYAEGHIKWYAIYKSIMNALPVILAFFVFYLGAAPYWSYIFMILIWAIGGDVVIVYYSHKQCAQKKRDFLFCVVLPVVEIVSLMLAGGLIVKIMMKPCFVRLVLTCVSTSFLFFISVWLLALNKLQRKMLIDFLKTKIHR